MINHIEVDIKIQEANIAKLQLMREHVPRAIIQLMNLGVSLKIITELNIVLRHTNYSHEWKKEVTDG